MFSRMLKSKLDSEDQEGFTPFMRMCLANELEGAKYLLTQGCKIDF